MQIYLPIAEISPNFLLIMGLGGTVGFVSGLFGVGGGFLLTPLLIFSGIPPSVAIASVTSQIVASSTSGALSYWRRKGIDLKLAFYLILAGITGAFFGVSVFGKLRAAGQLDLVISISYLFFLGLLGIIMLSEATRAILRAKSGDIRPFKAPGQHNWIHGLPFRVRFKASNLYVSILPVIVIGSSIGFIGSLLGIGGGFILVPALVYILRVPGNIVIGTSLLQVLAIMAVTTVLHAVNSQTVDVMLAFLLMLGGVLGAQFGAALGQKLRGEQLRFLLGLLVLAVALNFAYGLISQPSDAYSLAPFVTGGL